MSPKVLHFPVMSEEVVKYLAKVPNGIYVDCTFGEGGHSRKILSMLGEKGRLIAFDIDDGAYELGKRLEKEDSRFTMVKRNFVELREYLMENGIDKIDGVVFDLGTSKGQLADPNRGFSYKNEDAHLDMRMSSDTKNTAADILNTYKRDELSIVFKRYGDIKNPSPLVNLIMHSRKQFGDIITAGDLNTLILKAFGEREFPKMVKKCYQALRIETNNEINVFNKSLSYLPEIIKKEGVICIITFHSLEENTFRVWKDKYCNSIQISDYVENIPSQFSFVTKGCILPSDLEIASNWSSRSAKLWVVQKN